MIKFLVSSARLSFPEFQALIITEIHLNHYKVSPCVSNFSLFSLFFLFTGVLHEGSTYWIHQGFNFLLEVFIEILFRGAQAFFFL